MCHKEPDKREVKIKDLKAKFSATLSSQFHHTAVSGIKGENAQEDHQESSSMLWDGLLITSRAKTKYRDSRANDYKISASREATQTFPKL